MRTKFLILIVFLTSHSLGQAYKLDIPRSTHNYIPSSAINQKEFPKDFLFGTATSAYQVEGAWNINGKGENIWDWVTREHPEVNPDRSNGNIACDSYHKIQEDVALLKKLGVGFYRFSLSWSRILPRGLDYKVNPDGIRYYNELIDTLLQNNITPLVTLFHFDIPRSLNDLGGFTNEFMVGWFENYASVAFENFGDRVKWWLTFNEPRQLCLLGYGQNPLNYYVSGIAEYLCGHTVLKAHARVYHLYNQTYRQLQNGTISITLDCRWSAPKTSSSFDIDAAERSLQFELGWFANPIFHPNGDYPDVMKTFIADRSRKEGFKESRLPVFTQREIDYIKGTYDFFAINHYYTRWVENTIDEATGNPSYANDLRINYGYGNTWPSKHKSISKVNPSGFRNLLNWIKNKYGDNEIYVIENGYNATDSSLNDQDRINYYKLYLSALLDAIYKDNVNVKGYTVWSLLDAFEWFHGYTTQFGIHHVDFNDPERKRTPKASASYLRKVFANRRLV